MFKKGVKISFIFLGFFILSTILQVLFVGFFNHTWSPLMVIRNNEALGVNEQYSGQQRYVPIDSISPHLILAVMCAEDQKFPEHNGFDFDAIEKAQEHNKTHDNKIGASTISQQTAKNVFMWNGRNWVRKGFETYFTFLMETLWSKRRVMEAYLNIIEMGDGIFGAEAAARYYYDKSANDLTEHEAASIAAILPNPKKWSPTEPDRKMARKIRNILKFMVKYKHLLDDLGIVRETAKNKKAKHPAR
ncbi:MAG TPA: monofunctional biosynthetic peptidoglycan transglycosylase [Flavobacteriales bacterium]|nr:monofunctional biosynthetic peptidoglycan transglycosylase [Flavobacteriales bacterium]